MMNNADKYNMKKIFAFLILFLSCCCFFAEEKKIIGFDAGLVTCIPVYGDTSSPFKNRVIIGADGDITFRLGNPLKFMVGADFISDINWDGNLHSNHIDYALWGGIKVYPGIGGLNASLAYTIGARTDFEEDKYFYFDGIQRNDSNVEMTAWGNGFRIAVEYDFLHNSSRKALPAIGMFYRFMPRGSDSYDNIFAFYANMSF